MKQVTIEHRGKQITAGLSEDLSTSGDSEDSVRARVLQWLEKHPDLLDRDQIVLGGG